MPPGDGQRRLRRQRWLLGDPLAIPDASCHCVGVAGIFGHAAARAHRVDLLGHHRTGLRSGAIVCRALRGRTPGIRHGRPMSCRTATPAPRSAASRAGTVSADAVADLLGELIAAAPDVVSGPRQSRGTMMSRKRTTVGPRLRRHRWDARLPDRRDTAPTWMQEQGLEWLHRAGSEPSRLAMRYYARDIRTFCRRSCCARCGTAGGSRSRRRSTAVKTVRQTVRLLGPLPRPTPSRP